MSDSTKAFYDLLFDEGEFVCLSKARNGIAVFPVYTAHKTQANQFSINPLRKSRANRNVTAYRNLMFEFDGYTREAQIQAIKDTKIPFSSIVWSGKRSYHVIVSLKTPLPDEEMYKVYWKCFAKVFDSHDIKADITKDPARLSRTPNTVRADTGQIQSLIKLKRRYEIEEIDYWLSKYDIKAIRPEKPPEIDLGIIGNADQEYKWECIKKAIDKQFGAFEKGKRHDIRLYAYKLCKSVGFDQSTAQYYVDGEFFLNNDTQAMDPYRKNWDTGKWVIMKDRKQQVEYERAKELRIIEETLSEETKKLLGL